MEKVIFFFRRKEDLSREEFREHYVQVHSPLGLRNCLLLEGYVVNLVLSEGEFDAVTMLWSSSIADFSDVDKSYAKPEDLDEILADEKTYFRHPHRLSLIVDEEVVVGDNADPSTLTGGKVISVYAPGGSLPPVLPQLLPACPWLMLSTASRRGSDPNGEAPNGSGIPKIHVGPSPRWSSPSRATCRGSARSVPSSPRDASNSR